MSNTHNMRYIQPILFKSDILKSFFQSPSKSWRVKLAVLFCHVPMKRRNLLKRNLPKTPHISLLKRDHKKERPQRNRTDTAKKRCFRFLFWKETYLQAVALSFGKNFRKCHFKWVRLYNAHIRKGLVCILTVMSMFTIYSLSHLKWHLNILPMGCLRLVGSLKSYISFAKEPYKRDDILQKKPIFLRSLLIVATPYPVFLDLAVNIQPILYRLYMALMPIIGLFGKRALQKRPIFFKETYSFNEPTNRSHPIGMFTCTTSMGWLRLVGSLKIKGLFCIISSLS